MNLAREYDRWHQRVFEADPGHADESSPWYSLVLEHMVPLKGRRVLEVACGRGGFVRVLAARGALVCGADFSASAVRIARQKLHPPGVNCVPVALTQADAQYLPYADSSFDIVISCETIEHLPNPRAAIREMARVCRPGGLLYLTTPNYANLLGLYEIYARMFRRQRRNESAQPLDRRFLFFQIRRLVCEAGWEILRSDGTVHQVMLPRRNPLRLRFLESNRRLRRWLSPLALHYLLIARNGVRCT